MEAPPEQTPQSDSFPRQKTAVPPENTPYKAPRFVEMKPFLSRIQPIEGVFSPEEELQNLWALPTEKRQKALAVFKNKLARQREAWALCRTTLEDRIEHNPDLPRREAFEIIRQFASHYGFAQPELRFASRIVSNYFIARARTLEARSKHPDNLALIDHLTGIKFGEGERETFDVSVGPISIDITTNATNASRIYNKTSKVIPNLEYAGFAGVSKTSPLVSYTVLNADSPDVAVLPHLTLAHEHEHVINRLLPKPSHIRRSVGPTPQQIPDQGVLGSLHKQVLGEVLNFERRLGDQLWEEYKRERNPDKQRVLLGEYFKLGRDQALDSAKSEILAMAKGRHPWPYSELFLAQDGSDYDYLAVLRNYPPKKDDPVWQDMSRKILVDGYRKIIKGAIQAFDRLHGQGGYTPEEVIAIFTDKSLPEWPKTARRLLEQKRKL